MELKTLDELLVAGVARFRINIYRQRGSLAIVARVIPTEIPTIESLGPPAVLGTVAQEERGLILVTGATGSGKSTTLAALINQINATRSCHILTIEDPIEFLHQNRKASVSQREIGPDTKNYVVGEMRDAESIDIALKAAETGHLVFSTVHTTDAAGVVPVLWTGYSSCGSPSTVRCSIRSSRACSLRSQRGILQSRVRPSASSPAVMARLMSSSS